jgi:hypothetical protein
MINGIAKEIPTGTRNCRRGTRDCMQGIVGRAPCHLEATLAHSMYLFTYRWRYSTP